MSYKKLIYLLLANLLMLSSLSSLAQRRPVEPRLVQKRVHPQVSVGIPADFRAMNEDEIVSKYQSVQKSLGLYTEQYGGADLGITLKTIDETSWGQADLAILENFYRAFIINSYTDVQFIQEGRRMVDGQEVIFFEFVGRLSGQESAYGNRITGRYQCIQYAIVDGDIVVFNFNCPARMRTKWEQTARAIMDSVKLKT